VLETGDQIPEAHVWLAPREPVTMSELVADGPALFVFFLFAWAKVNRKEQRGLERASGLEQHV
jgi:hypothetical protein